MVRSSRGGWGDIAALAGDAGPAISFLSIFVLLASGVTALVFRRLATIKDELVAGRGVIARWRVGREPFARFAHVAGERDRAEKRQALYLVLGFLLVIFGAFALYDPEGAAIMLGVGAGVGVLIVVAYILGQNATAEQLKFRTGEMIVGARGLLCDGVLHAWDAPLSWLVDASLERDGLEVTYAYHSRSGPQYVTVLLPVSDEAPEAAAKARDGLLNLIEARR